MRTHLTKAIEGDETYFPKAATDPDLLPFKEVAKVLDALTVNAQKEAQARQERLHRWIRFLTSVILPFQEQIQPLQLAIEMPQKAQNYVSLRQALAQSRNALQQTVVNIVSHIAPNFGFGE